MSLLVVKAALFMAISIKLGAQNSPSSTASTPKPAYSHELPAMDGNHLRVFVRVLLPGRVVSLAGADLEVFLQSDDFDGAIAAIGIEIGRLIRDNILAAQLVFNS
jgi:hypothetical protein